MQSFQPNWLADHGHLVGHSGPSGFADALLQSLQVSNHVGEFTLLDGLVQAGRHQ